MGDTPILKSSSESLQIRTGKIKLIELFSSLKGLFHWFLQERDKLLRYRKQRKKMAKLPKVGGKMLTCVYIKHVFKETT